MQFQACAYCDHPNPVGTNYCNDCGAALHLKPCRHCGAVAVAQARHCPACQAAFTVRPMIDVDIPWAVAGAPQAGAAGAPAHSRTAPAGGDEDEIDAASPSFVATRRLIEKASERANERVGAKALVLPPRDERDHGAATRSAPRNPDRGAPATRFGPVDAVPVPARNDRALLAPRPVRQPRRSQVLPVIVLSLLGLVVAVALLFLIDYAGTRDTVREVAFPRKILHPGTAEPPAEAAGPPGTAATTATVPTAAANTATSTDASTASTAANPTPSAAPASTTASTTTSAAVTPAPEPASEGVLPASPSREDVAARGTPPPGVAVPTAAATDASAATTAPAATFTPATAPATAATAATSATSATPSAPATLSLPATSPAPILDAAPGPQRASAPSSAGASESSTTSHTTMSTTDSMPASSAPARTDAPSTPPVEPAGCRPELQALGLCDKVSQ